MCLSKFNSFKMSPLAAGMSSYWPAQRSCSFGWNNSVAKETEAQEYYITCMGIIYPGSGCVETHTGIISL